MTSAGGSASSTTTVEPDAGCPAKDRLGPYPTQEEAARALETVRRRNEEWDAQDDDW